MAKKSGIKQNFNLKDFTKALNKSIDQIEQQIINALFRLGEDCVKMSRLGLNIDPGAFPIDYGDDTARSLKTRQPEAGKTFKLGEYMDQTGNLRSSIGYIVVAHGDIITQNFQGSGDGMAKGKQLALEKAANITQGFGLIIVAGMKYAVHVESKGYNVIASAEKYAKEKLPNILSQLSN